MDYYKGIFMIFFVGNVYSAESKKINVSKQKPRPISPKQCGNFVIQENYDVSLEQLSEQEIAEFAKKLAQDAAIAKQRNTI